MNPDNKMPELEQGQPATIPVAAESDATIVDSITQYMNQAGRHDLLTPEEEASLGKQVQAGLAVARGEAIIQTDLDGGESAIEAEKLDTIKKLGESALDSLISSNLRLVISVARKNRGFGEQLVDVIQEGNIGLKRAAEKFDPAKGYKFSTYATWWIRQAIQRGRSDNDSTEVARLPGHVRQEYYKIDKTIRSIDTGHMPRQELIARVAEETGFSVEKINDLLTKKSRLSYADSLDMPIGKDDSDAVLADVLSDKHQASTEQIAISSVENEDLFSRVASLSDRERTVISLRYGLLDGVSWTLEEVGELLGLTRERVRQIQNLAHQNLRKSYERFPKWVS